MSTAALRERAIYQHGSIPGVRYFAAVMADGPSEYIRFIDAHFNANEGAWVATNYANGAHFPDYGLAPPTITATGPLTGGPKTWQLAGINTDYASFLNGLTNLGDGPLTVEWFMFRFIDQGVEAKLFDTANNNLQITTNGSGVINVNQAGGLTLFSSTSADTTGSWFHYAYTKNGAANHLYRNGVDVTGVVTNQTFIGGNFMNVGINRTTSADPFAGAMSEVALYTKVLSQAQVQAHYNAR